MFVFFAEVCDVVKGTREQICKKRSPKDFVRQVSVM